MKWECTFENGVVVVVEAGTSSLAAYLAEQEAARSGNLGAAVRFVEEVRNAN